jgi:hypothetical protein
MHATNSHKVAATSRIVLVNKVRLCNGGSDLEKQKWVGGVQRQGF